MHTWESYLHESVLKFCAGYRNRHVLIPTFKFEKMIEISLEQHCQRLLEISKIVVFVD